MYVQVSEKTLKADVDPNFKTHCSPILLNKVIKIHEFSDY